MSLDEYYEQEQTGNDLIDNITPEETFLVMNKDILLQYDEYNRLDRVIRNGDYVLVQGQDSLIAGINIILQMSLGEMWNNPTYLDRGNGAYQFLKKQKSVLNDTQIEDAIVKALESMNRIKKVEVISIGNYDLGEGNDPEGLQVDLVVTGVDDQTYKTSTIVSH